jgi:hypothetical protein
MLRKKFCTLLSHVTICPLFFRIFPPQWRRIKVESDADMGLIWYVAVTLLLEIFISMLLSCVGERNASGRESEEEFESETGRMVLLF